MKAIAIALALLLAACKPVAAPIAGPDPVDPYARIPAVRHQPVLGAYVSRRPVEPGPWREQNERVTPREQR
jgi:hypothetical protein